ncbi:MAG TPA: hypothetical protein VKU87_12185 [Thermomicrobiaceae bacterium]|nr:hypothetical protein [Thermomicrobiaceae bacterium]
MKFLVKATIPVETGNRLVAQPEEFFGLIQQILADVRPEAFYFALADGQRNNYFIVDVQDGSELPRIAEPFWQAMNAHVEAIPVMDQADIEKSMAVIQEIAPKYAR